jgi:multidrug efflux pump subunit AcrA (membrane-fusion protein)
VLIRSDAFPGEIFHGEVQEVTPKGDPVARTFRVRVKLPADTPLLIGMTTETNIVLRRSDTALLVPAAAVRGDMIWRVADGRVAATRVKLGAKGVREVEILSGLDERDWILAAPPQNLKDGARIRPVTQAITQ